MVFVEWVTSGVTCDQAFYFKGGRGERKKNLPVRDIKGEGMISGYVRGQNLNRTGTNVKPH